VFLRDHISANSIKSTHPCGRFICVEHATAKLPPDTPKHGYQFLLFRLSRVEADLLEKLAHISKRRRVEGDCWWWCVLLIIHMHIHRFVYDLLTPFNSRFKRKFWADHWPIKSRPTQHERRLPPSLAYIPRTESWVSARLEYFQGHLLQQTLSWGPEGHRTLPSMALLFFPHIHE
jgi:hypothetical protein